MSSSRVSLRHSGLVLEALLTARRRACSSFENATFVVVAPGTQGRDAAQTRRQYHGRHVHHTDDTNNTNNIDDVISRELCSSARMAERRRARWPWRSGPTATFSTAAAAVPPASSTSPPSPPPSPPPPSSVSLSLTPAAVNKIKELQEKRGDPSVGLRLLVSGGGCSGFQYEFVVEGTKPKTETETDTTDDAVLEVDGVRLYCDEMSLEFVKGSTVDYEDDMIQSKFIVRENPNAELGCGCGSSFSVAM